MNRRTVLCGTVLVLGLLCVAVLFSVSYDAQAVPSLARKYETSCSTCHYAYPRLNAFGKSFKNSGLRYPEDDEAMTKDIPVSLGADAYKRVFPKAIWPAEIPGLPPVGFHLFSRANLQTDPPDDEVVNLSFEFPHELELLFTGTLGENLSFFGEIELEHADELAYEYYVRYRYRPFLQLKVGNVNPWPIDDGLRLGVPHYNYVNFRVPGAGGDTRWRSVSNAGLEILGAGPGLNGKGGFTYKLGVINGQSEPSNDDINDAKDVYARATFKLGGLSEIGGTESQTGASSDAWRDDSARIGVYGYLGKDLYQPDGQAWENSYRILGADLDLWYCRFNLFGTFMLRKDDDPTGDGTENNAAAAFGELNMVTYPWLIGFVRFEWTDVNTDDSATGDGADPTTRMSLIPGIVALARANLRVSVDAQIPLDEISRDTQGTAITSQVNLGF